MNDWLSDVTTKYKSAKGGSDVKVAMQQVETLVRTSQRRRLPARARTWPRNGRPNRCSAQAWAGAVEPLDGLIPSRSGHWVFRQENQYGGNQWAAPLYLIGQPFCYNKKLFEQAGLDPSAPPKTWDDLLAACAKLKAEGITPLAIGNKDTFGGRWAFAFLAVQTLDSLG